MNDDELDLASEILKSLRAIEARSAGRGAGIASSRVNLDAFLLANPADSILAVEAASAEASAADSDFDALINDMAQWDALAAAPSS